MGVLGGRAERRCCRFLDVLIIIYTCEDTPASSEQLTVASAPPSVSIFL
jgi:hypothetical protein